MSRLTRRGLLKAGAGMGAAGALLGLGAAGAARDHPVAPPGLGAPPQAGPAFLSLLAVGDTGKPSHGMGRLASGRRVARALTAAHRRRPCDGLVLLGDNFYPHGLEKAQMAEQVRDRLAVPYRAFLQLSRSGESRLGLSRACAACNAVPVYAVLGNHDHHTRESATLQCDELPDLIPNLHISRRKAKLYELGEGVSLITFESVLWQEGAAAQLARCLARSAGPFRVLATHYPMSDPGNNHHRSYVSDLRRLLAEVGVPVQLFLSGHEHNLQLLRMESPAPPLHVIAGSGSYVRSVSRTRARRIFAAQELGFARVDRREIGGRAVLDVHLYALESWPWNAARLAARAWVDAAGRVQAWVAS